MLNSSEIMKTAWTHFRRVALPGRPFDRKLFADVLRFLWQGVRNRIEARRAEAVRMTAAPIVTIGKSDSAPHPMSEMKARIDGLKFLSARYRIDLMAAAIRAEYAHA